jgi:hypothetical protein
MAPTTRSFSTLSKRGVSCADFDKSNRPGGADLGERDSHWIATASWLSPKMACEQAFRLCLRQDSNLLTCRFNSA